jgi:hypothetical protein
MTSKIGQTTFRAKLPSISLLFSNCAAELRNWTYGQGEARFSSFIVERLRRKGKGASTTATLLHATMLVVAPANSHYHVTEGHATFL